MTLSDDFLASGWLNPADPDDWLWGGNPDRATRYFDGMMDEIRVSSTVRSEGWIRTSVNNQSNAAGFITVGSAESESLSLTDVAGNDLNPPGDTVLALIQSAGGDRITDADGGAVEGIAVVGVDDTNGQWQYNTGSGWTAFGAVSDAGAVLLDTAASVRFVPNASYSGSAGNLTFYAWDQTSGANGDTGVNATSRGGSSAFSVVSDEASLTVFAVNDAPINTVPGTQNTDQDTTLVFSAGNGNQISISDDAGPADSLTVTLSVTNGTVTLSQTTGLTFINGDGSADATMRFSGTQADINAALDGLSYAPTTSWVGTETLTITTNDMGNPVTALLDSDPNLVSRYSFAVDGSDDVGSNDLVLNNGASIVADAIRGNVLETDGLDDFAAMPAATTSGRSVFSFSVWVRTTDSGSNPSFSDNPTLFGIDTSGGGSGDFAVTISNGNLGMWTGLDGIASTDFQSSTQINDDQWHMVTVSNDGSTVSLYSDGVLLGTLNTGDPLDPREFFLGALNVDVFAPNDSWHLDGRFDDFRFFDRALTAGEVADLYGATDTDTVTINVNDVNDPPTVSLSNTVTTLPEDTDTSSAIRVADITVTDDALGTNNLSLVGADAALFQIVGNELQLVPGAPLDFETNATLDVSVQVDDPAIPGSPEDAAALAITITNVNEAPSVVLSNTITVLSENTDTSSPVRVADITVIDDGTGTNNLTLAGADAALFQIVGNQLQLVAGAALDFETNNTLDVAVQVDDPAIPGDPDDAAALAITITDVNEAPTVTLSNSVTTLPEDADTSGAIRVADITVTDDGTGTNNLTLAGADAALFQIVGNELQLVPGAPLDFETNATLDVTVQVDDPAIPGSPDDTAALAITITNVNEAPTVSLSNTITVLSENTDTSSPLRVADINVIDDGTGTNNLTLTGADAALFQIVGNELQLVAGAALDFDANPLLDVTVQVDDPAITGSPDDAAALAITITDVNDPPAVSLSNTITVLSENTDTSSPVRVADITVTDDSTGTNTLTLAGADAGAVPDCRQRAAAGGRRRAGLRDQCHPRRDRAGGRPHDSGRPG